MKITIVIFILLLLTASYYDLKKREIPDIICICIGIISLFNFHPLGFVSAVPFYIAAVLEPEKMGGGDIKLTAAVGVYLGFSNTLMGAMLGLSLSIVTHYILKLLIKKKDMAMPLAPFLSIGFIATLLN